MGGWLRKALGLKPKSKETWLENRSPAVEQSYQTQSTQPLRVPIKSGRNETIRYSFIQGAEDNLNGGHHAPLPPLPPPPQPGRSHSSTRRHGGAAERPRRDETPVTKANGEFSTYRTANSRMTSSRKPASWSARASPEEMEARIESLADEEEAEVYRQWYKSMNTAANGSEMLLHPYAAEHAEFVAFSTPGAAGRAAHTRRPPRPPASRLAPKSVTSRSSNSAHSHGHTKHDSGKTMGGYAGPSGTVDFGPPRREKQYLSRRALQMNEASAPPIAFALSATPTRRGTSSTRRTPTNKSRRRKSSGLGVDAEAFAQAMGGMNFGQEAEPPPSRYSIISDDDVLDGLEPHLVAQAMGGTSCGFENYGCF